MTSLGAIVLDALRGVRAHATRFVFTSMGIVWGVMMLTYLSASMDGYDEHFARQVAKIGQRIVFLFPGTVTKSAVGQRNARPVEVKRKDVARLPALHAVERAAPNLWVDSRVFRARGRTKLVYTYGVTADTAAIRAFEVGAGRFISEADVTDEATVVFLGAKTARRLLGDAPAVGRTVHIDGLPFRVVGVSQPKGDQLLYVGPPDDEMAMIPITTAQRWFVRHEVVNEVIFAPRTREASWEALAAVRGLLGLHLHFRPDDESAMGAFNVQEVVQIIDGLLLGLRLFLSAASLVTLFVGSVGVMNIMLVMVSERTREIGLRKAIGAPGRAIFLQFLTETLAVTLVAGAVGVLLGWLAVSASAAAIGAGNMLQGPPLLRVRTVLFVAVTLIATGVAAGILPAIRATRIDPAVSLRSL